MSDVWQSAFFVETAQPLHSATRCSTALDRSLENSEHALAAFRSLDARRALRAREHETKVAWDQIVAQLRGYMEQLEVVRNRRDLSEVIRTLPPMRKRLAAYRVDRASGLDGSRVAASRSTLRSPP